MRFGLALPQYDFSLPGPAGIDWSFVRDWAHHAEALGFDSVWISDHLFLDVARYGGPDQPRGAMECLGTLAALGAATSRLRLGTLVVCNDLRPPAIVAKTAANIDVISGGRLELGIGAGWYERDFKAAGVPPRCSPGRPAPVPPCRLLPPDLASRAKSGTLTAPGAVYLPILRADRLSRRRGPWVR